jgi:putative glycosyltransferase (TIGR04348 family)
MKILIITPAPPRSRSGNRVTALRWSRILRALGHHVKLEQAYERGRYDVLIALHARRSYESIARFHQEHRDTPVIVALTGTDVYRDLPKDRHALRSLDIATRVVVLQPSAIESMPSQHKQKARVIYQSVRPSPLLLRTKRRSSSSDKSFDVCVIGHLRPVKDPFRPALASRLLPSDSRVRILHIGRAMSDEMARRAKSEMSTNARYQWLGELPPGSTLSVLARSKLCILSSKMEGGANVLSEAITLGVPVISTRIPGSVGILGTRYDGYFTVGATRELADLLYKVEQMPALLELLRSKCKALRHLFVPEREKKAWQNLLSEISADLKTPARTTR